MNTVARLEPLIGRAGEIYMKLMDDEDDLQHGWRATESEAERRSTAFALLVAALRDTGRYADKREGRLLLGNVVEYSNEELHKAIEAASDIKLPWQELSSYGKEIAVEAELFREELRNTPIHSLVLPPTGGQATSLSSPKKAKWHVHGILGIARVHMLSGYRSAGKSMFREAMMAASLLGQPFLGREVQPLRWLIIDGE